MDKVLVAKQLQECIDAFETMLKKGQSGEFKTLGDMYKYAWDNELEDGACPWLAYNNMHSTYDYMEFIFGNRYICRTISGIIDRKGTIEDALNTTNERVRKLKELKSQLES